MISYVRTCLAPLLAAADKASTSTMTQNAKVFVYRSHFLVHSTYHTTPNYTTLHYTKLHHPTPHYTTLHYTTPHHTTPHHTTLHYTTPHLTTLHHTTLHYTTPHHTPTQHTTPHNTTPHHTTPQHTTPHHTTPHNTKQHHTRPHYTTPHTNKIHQISTDIDECLTDTHQCSHNCENIVGSYKCLCPAGYFKSSKFNCTGWPLFSQPF